MKTIGLLLIVVLLSGSAAAGNQDLRIAMLLWRGETAAETGFREGLQERGYDTVFTVFDCEQDVRKLGSILHSLKNNAGAFDYIYTFGTTVSRRAKVVIGGQIPQIFNIVTDPVAAGIVDSLNSPGRLIGGGSDKIGIAEQLDAVMQLFTIEKIGYFFNPREKNSLIIREEIHRLGTEQGIEIIDFRSPPAQDALSNNLQQLIQHPELIDVVYLAPDSYLVSEAKFIGAQLRSAKIKSMSQVRSLIEHGVLMGVTGDYYDLGKAVAEVVDRHQKGNVLGEIPVEHFKTFNLIINEDTVEILGLTFDESVYAKAEMVE